MAYDTTTSPHGARASSLPNATIRERAEATVARQREALARHTPTGVSWSGLTQNPPPVVDRVEDVVARIEADEARHAAFRATPAGRFVRAAGLIYEATGDERLLQCFSRGLETNVDLAERILANMSGPAVEVAAGALADWRAEQRAAA